jgi:hypothetical protein
MVEHAAFERKTHWLNSCPLTWSGSCSADGVALLEKRLKRDTLLQKELARVLIQEELLRERDRHKDV